MIKRLIMNADDFGMTLGNTIATLYAHTHGIVTSTTCMMNMPYAEFALNEAKKYPNLGVGIHLVLTVGRPLVDGAKSYTDENGDFIRPANYPDKKPHADPEELYVEWKAQIEKFIQLAGKKPTHIDSHHHVHLIPEHLEVVKRLAKEYDLPMRQREQVYDGYEFIPLFSRMYDENANYDFVVEKFKEFEGSVEFMCHPAFIDQRLAGMTSYLYPRLKEFDLLVSDELQNFIKENNIELINFTDLKKNG